MDLSPKTTVKPGATRTTHTLVPLPSSSVLKFQRLWSLGFRTTQGPNMYSCKSPFAPHDERRGGKRKDGERKGESKGEVLESEQTYRHSLTPLQQWEAPAQRNARTRILPSAPRAASEKRPGAPGNWQSCDTTKMTQDCLVLCHNNHFGESDWMKERNNMGVRGHTGGVDNFWRHISFYSFLRRGKNVKTGREGVEKGREKGGEKKGG